MDPRFRGDDGLGIRRPAGTWRTSHPPIDATAVGTVEGHAASRNQLTQRVSDSDAREAVDEFVDATRRHAGRTDGHSEFNDVERFKGDAHRHAALAAQAGLSGSSLPSRNQVVRAWNASFATPGAPCRFLST